MSQLVERVRLLHELAQLRAAEELLDRGHDRPDVDELLGRRLLGLDDGHALANDPLHPEEADAELALDQLADGANPAVAKEVGVSWPDPDGDQLDDPTVSLHVNAIGHGCRGLRALEGEPAGLTV